MMLENISNLSMISTLEGKNIDDPLHKSKHSHKKSSLSINKSKDLSTTITPSIKLNFKKNK